MKTALGMDLSKKAKVIIIDGSPAHRALNKTRMSKKCCSQQTVYGTYTVPISSFLVTK